MAALICGFCHGQLFVDFNSTSQDDGPHNDTAAGFSAYDAGHEVDADFVTTNYDAFGTTIALTPSWSNTTDNRVQQMIDRGAGNDANWGDATSDLGQTPPVFGLDLITDFIGIDTRAGNGGNGDWDGTVGTPTYLDITMGGLPANAYYWQSTHIDTENVHGDFAAWISTDGGSSFVQLPDGVGTAASPGGSPEAAGTVFAATNSVEAEAAGARYSANFSADGTSDVVMRFAPYAGDAVHRQIFALNGLVVQEVAPVPEPNAGGLMLLASLAVFAAARRRR